MYRNLILSAIAAFALPFSVAADEALTAVFNFHESETLEPSVPTPGLKESVDLDGRSFTCNGVEVAFTASESGNTHVRLYGSYDAGTDLRIYDGETMTVRSLDPSRALSDIVFTVSFSGGNADADFTPSVGEYVWVDNTWLAPEDESVTEVELMSNLQSRLYTMTVTLAEDGQTSVVNVAADNEAEVYYTLGGVALGSRPSEPGIYLVRRGGKVSKVFVR